MPPNAVRWDPTRENLLFLNQSANLYANYYQLQIAVHRPFIPSPRKPSPLSFPSLAICTNAARSCIHVLDMQYKRAGMPTYSNQARPLPSLSHLPSPRVPCPTRTRLFRLRWLTMTMS